MDELPPATGEVVEPVASLVVEVGDAAADTV